MVPLLVAAEQRSWDGHASAIGAFNVNFYAQAEGILDGLKETVSPGIVQASKGANKFQGGPDKIQYMLLKAMRAAGAGCGHLPPIALHLDHGNTESAVDCIKKGYSSVMIDASDLPEEENIIASREIVKIAHPKGVSVEAEYGLLAGVEEDIEHQKGVYANPKRVPIIISQSGVDALAIAYGTSHGANKGKTDALNLSVISDSYKRLVANGMNFDHFLVSHGSSTVPEEFVDRINRYGGDLTGTSGVPEYMIVRAIANGMRKVNIDTDLRLAMTGRVRELLYEERPNLAEASELVGVIKDVFDGKIKAKDKKGNPVPPGEITDPRSWLQPIMDSNPDALREDYKKTNDEAFIEMMWAVSRTVSNHVAGLTKVFGSVGLAEKVDTTQTLEEMAESYAA